MDKDKAANLERAKAEEKAKRPPKDNSGRDSKSQSGQKHGTSRVSRSGS